MLDYQVEMFKKNVQKKKSLPDASADVLTSAQLISFKMAPWAVAEIQGEKKRKTQSGALVIITTENISSLRQYIKF